MLKIDQIAQVTHETNRAYCQVIRDYSQPSWEEAPEWQKESAIIGVQAYVENPNMTPEQGHESWMQIKSNNGWKYGKVKNSQQKEHPCMIPYSELPLEQRAKDALFLAVIKALLTEV